MVGPPAAQAPSRSRSGSKLETKTKHRLTGSVSDVPYSPEDLSSGDARGNGNSSSGAASSASLKDKKYRRRTRSSLGGTEDLIKELDTLAPGSNKPGSRESTPTPPTTPPAGVRHSSAPIAGTEYPALRAKPSDPGEDSEQALPIILGESSGDKESVASVPKVTSSEGSTRPSLQGTVAQVDSSVLSALSHPDVVELETQGGTAVQLKAGAYSTNEEKDLWICRQCGWTYPNAHPSAKHRRNHKKVCEKLYTGVEVPPGSSDDASSEDEFNNKVEVADQVSKAASSTITAQTQIKTDAKHEPVKHPGAVPRNFTKPTISTGSESGKNSPVSSPGKRDSPFSSPAKRDSHLSSPAKKETPWGSPIKRSTPVSSPSPSKKVSSPITSPVKRILSTPLKRNSPPRPEKQDGITRTLTAKQQQEEEERKISVKKRIEELERIAGSKPHTWKDYVADGKRSGELSSSGSPLRHGDDERRKSGEMSPGGKTLKHVESVGRKSVDGSPTTVSGKPLRHVQSSKRSGELSSTGSPLTHSVDGKSSRTAPVGEVAIVHSAGSGYPRSTVDEATATLPAESSAADGGQVAAPETHGTERRMSHESEGDMRGSTGQQVKRSVASEDTTSVQDAVTDIPGLNATYGTSGVEPSVEQVQADAAVVTSVDKVPSAGEHTYLGDKKFEEQNTEVLRKTEDPSRDEEAKQEIATASHSRHPSLVLDNTNTSRLTGANIPEDSEVLAPSSEPGEPSGQIVDAKTVKKEGQVPEVRTTTDSGLEEVVTPPDTETAVENKEAEALTTSPVKEESGPYVAVDTMPAKEQCSSEVAGPVAVEERVQSKPGDSSDAVDGKTEEKEIPSPSDVTVEPVADEAPLSTVLSETNIIKSPESDNAVGNVSPTPRALDHDDDTSVLLTKQPAVDPLFVDSQQDRLWEMHSQELTRRDGETSGTDMRESSAQDDDPIQYVNGSPLAPEASASGTTSNGNGVNEKGGKVDRPRTPLRSLIAEDDAADKGGDEGAPTGKETPIVSPRGNLFKRIVSGGKASPTKPTTPSMYEKKSHSKPFLSSCICCSPVK